MAEAKWLWPVPYTTRIAGGYTGSYADGLHSGIDIYDEDIFGKAVVASKSGTVSSIYSGCNNEDAKRTGVSCSATTGCSCNSLTTIGGVAYCNYGLGNAVYINHGDGTYSQYVHLTSYNVSVGDHVSQGDVIGYVGSTGESLDPHLHFSLSTTNNASGRYNNNPSVIDYIYSLDPTPPVSSNTYKITNVGASKCLNIHGDGLTSLYNEINVTLWSDSGTNEQKWVVSDLGNSVYIRSVIDTAYGLNVYRSGSPYNCNIYKIAGNETDALVDIIASGSYYKVKLHNYNLYLTVGASTNGTNVYWAASSNNDYQKWTFTAI